jgi:HD-like signal output (HDOD) protein
MNNIHYRLVLNGLAPGADIRKIAVYFQKDLELPSERIHGLLTSMPRVLKDFATHDSAETAQSVLSKSGCMTSLEPMVSYPSFPFHISQKHEIIIKRELSKVLRSRTSLALLVVQINAVNPQNHLPSMLGPFEEQIISFLRESDTVIGVDDSRLIVLGFATDKQGVVPIQSKIKRVIKKLFGNDVAMRCGYSIFPEDGQTIAKLIYRAVSLQEEKEGRGRSEGTDAPREKPADKVTEASKEEELTPIELFFMRARGRIYKRLLDMDSRTLWLGLSRIPQADQKEFLARLPFDSALTPELDEMVKSQSLSISDQAAENHFNAVIQQMELETHLALRDNLMENVMQKLNQSEDLPTLPSVASQIFNIASDPNSSGSELAAIVTKDPALTSKLLKTVNSAFYGSPQKISSVKHAIVLLGTEEIVDIAFGLAAAKVFDLKPVPGILDPKFLWHHAICTALIAQSVSRPLSQFRDVGVFTAGLLHDVGKIFLIANYPDIYRQLSQDAEKLKLPLFEMEEDYFGIHHAGIGRYLASQWNLPEALVNAITYHHQPYTSPTHSGVAAITGLADYLYYRAMGKDPAGHEAKPQWLTVGHWLVLTRLFKQFDAHALDDMTRNAAAVMEENKEYLDFLI